VYTRAELACDQRGLATSAEPPPLLWLPPVFPDGGLDVGEYDRGGYGVGEYDL
jgi:hypothetical protein